MLDVTGREMSVGGTSGNGGDRDGDGDNTGTEGYQSKSKSKSKSYSPHVNVNNVLSTKSASQEPHVHVERLITTQPEKFVYSLRSVQGKKATKREETQAKVEAQAEFEMKNKFQGKGKSKGGERGIYDTTDNRKNEAAADSADVSINASRYLARKRYYNVSEQSRISHVLKGSRSFNEEEEVEQEEHHDDEEASSRYYRQLQHRALVMDFQHAKVDYRRFDSLSKDKTQEKERRQERPERQEKGKGASSETKNGSSHSPSGSGTGTYSASAGSNTHNTRSDYDSVSVDVDVEVSGPSLGPSGLDVEYSSAKSNGEGGVGTDNVNNANNSHALSANMNESLNSSIGTDTVSDTDTAGYGVGFRFLSKNKHKHKNEQDLPLVHPAAAGLRPPRIQDAEAVGIENMELLSQSQIMQSTQSHQSITITNQFQSQTISQSHTQPASTSHAASASSTDNWESEIANMTAGEYLEAQRERLELSMKSLQTQTQQTPIPTPNYHNKVTASDNGDRSTEGGIDLDLDSPYYSLPQVIIHKKTLVEKEQERVHLEQKNKKEGDSALQIAAEDAIVKTANAISSVSLPEAPALTYKMDRLQQQHQYQQQQQLNKNNDQKDGDGDRDRDRDGSGSGPVPPTEEGGGSSSSLSPQKTQKIVIHKLAQTHSERLSSIQSLLSSVPALQGLLPEPTQTHSVPALQGLLPEPTQTYDPRHSLSQDGIFGNGSSFGTGSSVDVDFTRSQSLVASLVLPHPKTHSALPMKNRDLLDSLDSDDVSLGTGHHNSHNSQTDARKGLYKTNTIAGENMSAENTATTNMHTFVGSILTTGKSLVSIPYHDSDRGLGGVDVFNEDDEDDEDDEGDEDGYVIPGSRAARTPPWSSKDQGQNNNNNNNNNAIQVKHDPNSRHHMLRFRGGDWEYQSHQSEEEVQLELSDPKKTTLDQVQKDLEFLREEAEEDFGHEVKWYL